MPLSPAAKLILPPPPSEPMTGSDGRVTEAWRRYLDALGRELKRVGDAIP